MTEYCSKKAISSLHCAPFFRLILIYSIQLFIMKMAPKIGTLWFFTARSTRKPGQTQVDCKCRLTTLGLGNRSRRRKPTPQRRTICICMALCATEQAKCSTPGYMVNICAEPRCSRKQRGNIWSGLPVESFFQRSDFVAPPQRDVSHLLQLPAALLISTIRFTSQISTQTRRKTASQALARDPSFEIIYFLNC